MKLPNGTTAAIPLEKISDYLLSESHAVGRTKARFFRSLGYRQEAPYVLVNDLASIAQGEQVSEIVEITHGTKYIVDGSVHAPSGSSTRIRTVWIIESSQDIPRFVTAYPAS